MLPLKANPLSHLFGWLPHSRLRTGYQAKRSREIDFLRGFALVCIVLDHMQVSIFKIFTLQNYTLFDATELFVFLSGFSIALAYSKIALNRDEIQAKKRFLWRCIELYGAFWFTVIAMLIIGYICQKYQLDNDVVKITQIELFRQYPWHYLARVLFFGQQPYFSSILPMYIVFCASSVLLMPILSRYPVYVLIASFILWLSSAWILPNTIWSFNPLAWQFIFLCGMFCYLFAFYEKIEYEHPHLASFIVGISWIVSLSFAWFKITTHYQFQGVDKLNLSVIRLISFFSVAWLLYYYRSVILKIAILIPALQTIGRQSLPCFVASTIISLIMNTLCEHIEYAPWIEGLIADVLGITLLYLTGLIFDRYKSKPLKILT